MSAAHGHSIRHHGSAWPTEQKSASYLLRRDGGGDGFAAGGTGAAGDGGPGKGEEIREQIEQLRRRLAEAILTLRAVIANGDFDACRRFHLAQEHRRVHQDRHQDDPDLTA